MKLKTLGLRTILPAAAFAGGILLLTTSARPDGGHGDDDEDEVELEEAHIFFEYNSTDNDLGVHVFLDGEDWKKMKITKPNGHSIFEVKGKGAFGQMGLTELRFEGAEPVLTEFPLEELLQRFPEGTYEFEGRTVDGADIDGEGELSHAIPAGPVVNAQVGAGNFLRISWNPVVGNPPGFPVRPLTIVGYEVIVENFDVTLPGTATNVTVSPEFVATLGSGPHKYEVLAIESGGNKTITEATFVR